MPDPFANITEATPEFLEIFADVLEVRGANPDQVAIRDSYLSEIQFPQAARVLEVGCGTGAVSRALAKWPSVSEVIGVDPSPAFIAKARELGDDFANLSFEEADGRSLHFEDESFDVVIFHTVLCHIPEPEQAIAEAFRVLRSGGWLAAFDGDYAATTLATGDYDPLQACADAYIAAFVHDPWLVRRLQYIVKVAGFEAGSLKLHGFSEIQYMLATLERGADNLVARGLIGKAQADAIKAEGHRRAETGEFFGYMLYGSIIARKPEN